MASPPRSTPGGRPPFDLVGATVLFRRLLACTLVVFCGVPAFDAFSKNAGPGVHLLAGIIGTLCWLPVAGLAAVTATRLARELRLSGPWRYGFAAALPCPNLLAVTIFGAHMVPAWAAAGSSPLLLMQPRRMMRARAPRTWTPGRPSALGFVATFALLFVFLGAVGAVLRLLEGKTSSGAHPAASSAAAPSIPGLEAGFYRAFAPGGQAAFDDADSRLTRPADGEAALGNTPAAVHVAQRIGEAMEREVHKSQGAYPDFKPVLDAAAPFRVYVRARPERAAVLMRVPRFEILEEKARAALLHFAWRAATDELRSLRLVGGRRVALALRGEGPYAAVACGDLTDEEQAQSDTGTPADTAPIAAFFADVRLPVPLPSPSPRSTAARLLEERRHAPLHSTAEWKAFADAKTWDEQARQRSDAIRRYATTEDVESLLRASETKAMPALETRAALSLLSELSAGYDARIDLGQEGRLATALREHCSALVFAPGAVCSIDLRRAWARMDRSFLESTFERRLGETGQRDRDLWGLLIETRDHADPSRWPRLLETLVRTELRQGHGAGDAIAYWLEADPAAAERVVLEELSPRALDPDARAWLAHALLSVALVRGRADAAGARLAEIATLGGPAAIRARTAREIIGVGPQEGIESLAREWRETRSARSLGELYNRYLIELPVGTPFARWRERLGDDGSNAASRTSFHIVSGDSGASLYVELDKEGRLSAISFD